MEAGWVHQRVRGADKCYFLARAGLQGRLRAEQEAAGGAGRGPALRHDLLPHRERHLPPRRRLPQGESFREFVLEPRVSV